MKRIAALLFALLLLLPVALHADVAWVPPDDFLKLYKDECEWLPQSDQHYVALCSFHSYTSPLDSTFKESISKGRELLIKWVYTDEFGHLWGLYESDSGWVPMDAVTPSYSAKDYLRNHDDSVQPYAGELKYFLPSQKELDAIEDYRIRNDGGNGRGGVPSVEMAFSFPEYSAWRYPNSPSDYYNTIWSPDIRPLYTLTDDDGTTWVYAECVVNEKFTFWVNADDLQKRPAKDAVKLPPPVQEVPTHLPVPDIEDPQPISAAVYLSPVLPAILAVLGVVLLSAVLIVLLQRKKGD